MTEKNFHANGKLLLFGEYFVLDDVSSLAVPVRLGQKLITRSDSVQVKGLYWKSRDEKGEIWFEAYFDEHFSLLHNLNTDTALVLQKILLTARQLNPNFLKDGLYHEAETLLEFSRDSGLGSSSTLIHLIAQWAELDPLQLFFLSFPGSGYDIACAGARSPITYKKQGQTAHWDEAKLDWPWENIAFVHLGKKQNSREGIGRYRERSAQLYQEREAMEEIVQAALKINSLSSLSVLMEESEDLISKTLNLPKVKDELFADYPNSIKSLGAWGGDYVMALIDSQTDLNYFRSKGLRILESEQLLKD